MSTSSRKFDSLRRARERLDRAIVALAVPLVAVMAALVLVNVRG